MSYSGYQSYGGNPYGQSGEEQTGQAANPHGGQEPNPYGRATSGYGQTASPYERAQSGYGASNPYGTQDPNVLEPPPPLQHENSNYSQTSQYSSPSAPPTHQGGAPLSKQDFLARIEGARGRINSLSTHIQNIASIHQRLVSSPDTNASAQLESLVTSTQIRNTEIKDEIKFLERDAARDPGNTLKKTQVESLKRSFKDQLTQFQNEERDYRERYKDAVARQYRIVNPDATEAEVEEARNADWGDEGIFQQALKSNRSGQATSVLGAVRARHNDIQRIEKTMVELSVLFDQLAQEVVVQEQAVVDVERQAEGVKDDVEGGNTQLDQGIKSARRARKLKWWTLAVVVAIIAILALVLGIYFGTQ
ncbi:t-SNARE, partial [Aaosphaeria arxii CBS 175.79]